MQKIYNPATFVWTPEMESGLAKLGQSLTPDFSKNDLVFMYNLDAYRSIFPKNVDGLIGGVAAGLAFAETVSLTPTSTVTSVGFPAAHLKRVINAPDCNWATGAAGAALVAGLARVVPGGAGVAGFFSLVAAVYAILQYEGVPCSAIGNIDWDGLFINGCAELSPDEVAACPNPD